MKYNHLFITFLAINLLTVSNNSFSRIKANKSDEYTPSYTYQTDYYDAYANMDTEQSQENEEFSDDQTDTQSETIDFSTNVKKLDILAKDKCMNQVFDKEILQNSKPCVIKFTAKWCGPCQQMAPAFEQAAQAYEGKVDFIEIDIDKCKEIKSRFNIRSVPQLHFYAKDKTNKKAKKLVKVGEIPGGLSNPQHIKDQVKMYLKV